MIVSIISILTIARSTKMHTWEASTSFISNIFKFESDSRATLTPVQVASVLIQAGFPSKVVPIFTLIAKHESSYRPWKTHKNRNQTTDHGLLQINDIWMSHCKVTSIDLKDPQVNAKCALEVYRKQGLTAWSSYNKIKRQMYKNKSRRKKNRRDRNEEFIVEND